MCHGNINVCQPKKLLLLLLLIIFFFFASIKLYENSNFCLVLKRSSLKQKSAIYISPNRTIVIGYELVTWSQDLNDDFI